MPKLTKKPSLNQKIRAASKDLKALTRTLEKNQKVSVRLAAKVEKSKAKLSKLQAKAVPTAPTA